jgi:endonuclease/exonuclease/phosphatase family metal-dependent hydrolase
MARGKFQECSEWDTNGAQGIAEDVLGMRGYIAQSTRHPGGNIAVFVNESAGITVTGTRHEGLFNEERTPAYWHGVAVVYAEIEGYGPIRFASAHFAPSAPSIRQAEGEAFQLIAEQRPPLIAGGDWNAIPIGDPVPVPGKTMHPGQARRKADTGAACALSEYMTDVALVLGDTTPTVGHRRNGEFGYRCDRVYTTLPEEAIIEHEVIQETSPESDHKPVRARFRIRRSYLLTA